MKFLDGYWLKREGYDVMHPVHVYESRKQDACLSILAPVKKINERADVLNTPALNIYFDSPMEDVISVRIVHFSGVKRKNPGFEITAQDVRPEIIVDADSSVFRSGRLSAEVINDESWSLEFYGDEELLTAGAEKSIGYVVTPEGETYVHQELNLGIGELVYGLGERFGAFVKNGQVVDIWNKDGGTASEQAYKNIPFYISNRGYGVFVKDTGPVSFEIGSEKVNRVQFSVPGESLEYLIIYGPEPVEILKKYTALTGRPSLPPSWSFGLWLSTSFTTSYDEETVMGFIDEMAKRKLPLHVFHFDCFWMKAFRWCDFIWDDETFSDVRGLIERLHLKGIKVCLWINPYIAQNGAIFDEAVEKGYLIHKENGDVWQTDLWQAGMGIVDFTNPDAKDWYLSKLEPLLDLGVDSFKTDFGERIPVDVVYYDGSDPLRMHNYYSYLYNEAVHGLLKRKNNKPVLFARSATAGSQKFPVHWGGDCFSDFESMAESLRGGLSLSLCGFGFWSHDIGGFEGNPDPDVFKRWIAFGLLSSHSRLHGSSSYRVPWLIDEESVDVLRRFSTLKCRLMPYLFSKAVEAASYGIPVMRPMMFEFQSDHNCDYLDRQYMLGESLLVAPVFNSNGIADYYLPEGTWTELEGTRTVSGPCWVREEHDFMSLPLWVREASIIPTGSEDQKPDYDYRRGLILELYELPDGFEESLSITDSDAEDAAVFTIRCVDTRVTIQMEPAGYPETWSVLAVNRNVSSVEGADFEKGVRGSILKVEGSGVSFSI